MSEGLLTVLKFCFLALLYLFLARVVSVVVREMRADKPAVAADGPVASPPPSPVSGPDTNGRGRARGPSLRVLEPASRQGESFRVTQELTVGRAPGCAIVLGDDRFVSQVHARVFRREKDVYVEDLGSTNGTFVNGERVSSATRVQRGDTVQFGGTVVEVTR